MVNVTKKMATKAAATWDFVIHVAVNRKSDISVLAVIKSVEIKCVSGEEVCWI